MHSPFHAHSLSFSIVISVDMAVVVVVVVDAVDAVLVVAPTIITCRIKSAMFRFLFPFSLQLQLPVCFQQYTQFHLSWTLFIISHCTAKCWWSFILPISFKFQSQVFSISLSRICVGGWVAHNNKKRYNRIFSIMWNHIHDRQYNAMIENERE